MVLPPSEACYLDISFMSLKCFDTKKRSSCDCQLTQTKPNEQGAYRTTVFYVL